MFAEWGNPREIKQNENNKPNNYKPNNNKPNNINLIIIILT